MSTKEKLLRKSSIIFGVLILIGGIYLFTKLANPKIDPTEIVQEEFKKHVEVIEVKNDTVDIPLAATGILKASESVDIYADVSGSLLTGNKPFKTGINYKKGEALLSIDDTEQRLDLEYKKSDFYSLIVSILPDIMTDYANNFPAWSDYVANFDIKKTIDDLPAAKSDQEKYFLAAKNVEYKFIGIKKAEFTLAKYRVYAPFSGVLDQVNINPGALVRTGQKLGTYINENNYELEISIPVVDANRLQIGGSVSISADNNEGNWEGTIKRIGKTIDESSQTLIVYVSISGDNLFQGMYLNAAIDTEPIRNAYVIERRLISKENTVYALNNGRVETLTVKVVRNSDNYAAVTGIPDNTLLISSQTGGLQDGMAVEIIKK